jgi:hypothetical protein
MSDLLIQAVDYALDDEWDLAHGIAQSTKNLYSNWIHAVLHKIEGDDSNSRYWYAQTDHEYDEFKDPLIELSIIKKELLNK